MSKSQLYLDTSALLRGWPLIVVCLVLSGCPWVWYGEPWPWRCPFPPWGAGYGAPRGGHGGAYDSAAARRAGVQRVRQGGKSSRWVLSRHSLVSCAYTTNTKAHVHTCAIMRNRPGKACDEYNLSIVEISKISEMKLDPLQVKESWMAGTRTRGTLRDGSRTPVLAGGTSLSHSSRWAHTVGPTAASTAGQAGTSNGTTTATHNRGAEV